MTLAVAATFALSAASTAAHSPGTATAPAETQTVSAGFGSARAAAPAFTSWTETFVDTSRPTPAGGDSPGAPDRTLVTTIYRPKGKGPFPMIVYANALGAPPPTQLLGVWAAAGYVVASSAFLTPGALVDLPADTSFVLTQMLREP
jgi:hypothetical protein